MDLLEGFQRAGVEGWAYRPAPFWSWNDDLDPDELRRQIREMKSVGLGGHMMHARIGLITPYLGERWMECIRAAVEESAEIGVEAWLYDEDCWPSGSAGGRVPAKGEAFRQKWIVVRELKPEGDASASERSLATFVGERDGEGWKSLRRVSSFEEAKSASSEFANPAILHFSYDIGGYVDLMSRETVEDFIEEDYEVYRPVVGESFGKTVPGIFTDEPQWTHVPWSLDLPNYYRSLYGDDLLDSLPSLYYEIGDFRKSRYRFWSAATRLYVRSFSKRIGEWCESAGLIFTGHQMNEDSLGVQIRSVGAAMPHYPWMGMPGIDHLCRRIADPLLVKQVGSAGNQFGKRVLSEMYGCSGWNVSLEELKWIGEWQFALGVNFSCPHLSLYSLRGCRKRDYPPSLHYQQPWWPDYKLLNDRIARTLYALTQGKRVVDILLLHLIGSAWAIHDPNDFSAVNEMNRHFVGISQFLLGIHRDHDYGDEMILEDFGGVSGDKLKVGEAEYGVVVLPPLVSLQRTTAKLLRDFAASGGKIVLVGDGPERLDGEAGAEAEDFRTWLSETASVCPKDDPDALESALFAIGWPRVQVKDSEGEHAETIYVHQREIGSKRLYFLANASHDEEVDADLALEGVGAVEEWNLDDGTATALPVRQAMGNTALKLRFEPMGSHLIVLDSEKAPKTGAPDRIREVGIFYGESEWDLTMLDPNAITLDMARYRIDDEEWIEPTYVLHIQEALARRADDCDVTMEFVVESRMTETHESLYLVMELPEEHRISINGEPIESADEGWWTDISFRKIPISGKIQPGRNVIALKRRFVGDPATARLLAEKAVHESEGNRLKYGCEMESIYLIGDFGVDSAGEIAPEPRESSRHAGPFVLVDAPKTATTGDLTRQGLPFYRGTVALEQEIWIPERPGDDDVRVILEFEKLNAIVSKVVANGEEAGKLTWRPLRLDVTDHVTEGENLRLRLELTGSCRNLLGPHHHIDGELYAVGPNSFLSRKEWTDRGDAPDSTWSDGYSLVNFGVEGDVVVLFEAKG